MRTYETIKYRNVAVIAVFGSGGFIFLYGLRSLVTNQPLDWINDLKPNELSVFNMGFSMKTNR